MVDGRPTTRITPEREFNYAFENLNKAVDECNSSALDWLMVAIRSNEKALCKGEITENTYLDQQQRVTGLVKGFMYNCDCSSRSKVPML